MYRSTMNWLQFLAASAIIGLSSTGFAAAVDSSAPPTMTFAITPSSVQLYNSATLTWSSTNANSCTFSGTLSGTVNPQSNSAKPLQVEPTAVGSYTYNLTCKGTGGTVEQSQTLQVTAPPAPTVSFAVSPTSIQLNSGAATLTWSSTNATNCAISGALTESSVGPQSSTSNPIQVEPKAVGSYTYTLTCTGAGGSTAKSATLQVTSAPAPTVSFAISPASIQLNSGAATLTWTSTNATNCAITGALNESSVGPQSSTSTPIQVEPTAIGSYSYTLTCTGLGGSTAQSATLQVVAAPPPTESLSFSPSTIVIGSTSTMIWSSTNATSCTLSGNVSGTVGPQSSTSNPMTVTPGGTGSYTETLACTGSGGTTSTSATLTVTLPPPTLSFAVNPSNIKLGYGAILTWSSTNASSCTQSGSWSGTTGTASDPGAPATLIPTAAGTYTYNLTCTASGGSIEQTATLKVTAAQNMSFLDTQIKAAQATANNTSPTSSCGVISQNQTGSEDGFYWEIGNENGIFADTANSLSASGSVQPAGTSGTNYTRTTAMKIDSATKWLYGSYVAETEAQYTGSTWQFPSAYVPFLNFTSGYANMTDNCMSNQTVAQCLADSNGLSPSAPNGTQTAADVGLFDYNSGHLEVFEGGGDPSIAGVMNGASDKDANLASAITTALANKDVTVDITFVAPDPAGGVVTTARDYASFLQGLLNANDQLVMRSLLSPGSTDPYAVCTNPFDPTCVNSSGQPLAAYSPMPGSVSWEYSITHWIEDDPTTGDGSFSSPGKSGFYPWVDATKTYYGIVARYDTAGASSTDPTTSPFYLSAVCGAAIRTAFMTGVAQP